MNTNESRPVEGGSSGPGARKHVGTKIIAADGALSQPITEDADELATDLRCSRRHIEEMDRDGRLGPRAIRLGRRRVWNRAEVRKWIEAGAPDRIVWNAMRGGQR